MRRSTAAFLFFNFFEIGHRLVGNTVQYGVLTENLCGALTVSVPKKIPHFIFEAGN